MGAPDWRCIFYSKMGIFHCYVSLPKGNTNSRETSFLSNVIGKNFRTLDTWSFYQIIFVKKYKTSKKSINTEAHNINLLNLASFAVAVEGLLWSFLLGNDGWSIYWEIPRHFKIDYIVWMMRSYLGLIYNSTSLTALWICLEYFLLQCIPWYDGNWGTFPLENFLSNHLIPW